MADLNRPREKAENYVWDVGGLTWVVMTQPGGAASAPTLTTRSQVNDTAADALLLAANGTRKGATIVNTSSANLFVGLGTTTVTALNFTVRLVQHSYYELPYNFVGQVRGIWASDPGDGTAVITEFN